MYEVRKFAEKGKAKILSVLLLLLQVLMEGKSKKVDVCIAINHHGGLIVHNSD